MQRVENREPIDATEIGRLVVVLAHYFSVAGLNAAVAERDYNRRLAEYESGKDEAGKPLPSTKAKSYAEATDEYFKFIEAKAHVSSIEQMINALKSLQRGTINEYAHMGDN